MERLDLSMDEQREYERIDAAITEMARDLWELDVEYLEWLIGSWIMDDQGSGGTSLQFAAAAEFGCDASMLNEKAGDTSAAQQVVAWLKGNNGVRYGMTLYRGTSGREGMPLESWTADRDIAEFYARRNGGEVIEREFAADDILTTWRTGIGLECAEEVIVINRQ